MKLLEKWVFGLGALSLFSLTGCGASPASTQYNSEAAVRIKSSLEDRHSTLKRRSGGEFTRATDLFGAALISEGSYFVDTNVKPWPASFYPIRENILFKESGSTLKKYDLLSKKRRLLSQSAAEYEEKYYYRPDAPSWAGRCDAWAVASLMEKEPKVVGSHRNMEGIEFTEDDLKALLILSYESVEGITQFGQRSNGDYESDPEDLYPEQFHRIIQKVMIEENSPFIMDKDSGVEVWNTPVHKASMDVVADSHELGLFHVSVFLVGALPLNPDGSTSGFDHGNVTFSYTYDLHAYPVEHGMYQVVYGEWTGRSKREHPDFIWTLPTKKEHKSLNPGIDPTLVDEMIRVLGAPEPVFRWRLN